jgi:hypothetical protein
MRSATPESCGNADGVETVEIQQQDFHRSHSVLEISRKQRDSHIPTAPTVCYRVSTKQPRLKNWVRWKSGNPKAGFPLSHRTDGLRRKEETPESVYNAPGTMCIPCAGIDTHSCEHNRKKNYFHGVPMSVNAARRSACATTRLQHFWWASRPMGTPLRSRFGKSRTGGKTSIQYFRFMLLLSISFFHLLSESDSTLQGIGMTLARRTETGGNWALSICLMAE